MRKKRGNTTEDLKGQKFGKLKVIEIGEKRGKSTSTFWICLCDCGNHHIVSAQHLKSGQVKKCKLCPIKTDCELLKEAKIRFSKNIKKKNGCWIWKGTVVKDYGMMFYKIPIKSHRFSYMVYKGDLEKGKCICHTCDNPLCVNPDHLYQGTPKDNSFDAYSRNRMRTGEESHFSKLKEEHVMHIRSTNERGVDLANKYSVSKGTISSIRRYKTWKHKKTTTGGICGGL